MCIEMGKSSTNGGVSIAMFESPLWFGGHSGHVACPACPKIAIKNIGKIMFDIIDIPQKNANNREKNSSNPMSKLLPDVFSESGDTLW